MTVNNKISIIIPTLNEASEIGKTLAAISLFDAEVIVADGGSEDTTVEIARSFGAVVFNAQRGRGVQMREAADAATGNIIWFLHADTVPSETALSEIYQALEDPSVVGGNFRIRFGGNSLAARFMTWFYPLIKNIGLMYGDSGIFVRRETYEQVGGFKPLELFEDLDLIYRLRILGKLVTLNAEIVTSSRRFEGRYFLPVFLRWVIFQCLYWFGVSPQRLARSYYRDAKKDPDMKPKISNLR